MPIRLPQVDHDIPLKYPPLVEVICQVRFPPILRIGGAEPIEFQDRIRKRYPHYSREQVQGFRIELGSGAPSEPQIESPVAAYRFSSTDETSVATLARNFYAVVTTDYKGWPQFSSDIELVSDAVRDIYEPAYVARIGLRYINRLTTSNTSASSLRELLIFPRQELTQMMRTEDWGVPEQAVSEMVFSEGPQNLKVRFGLQDEEDEKAILLDFDYFESGQLDLADVMDKARAFHDIIYSAFRWCVPTENLEVFGFLEEAEGRSNGE